MVLLNLLVEASTIKVTFWDKTLLDNSLLLARFGLAILLVMLRLATN